MVTFWNYLSGPSHAHIFTKMVSNHLYFFVTCFSIKIHWEHFPMIINVLCKHHSYSCLIFYRLYWNIISFTIGIHLFSPLLFSSFPFPFLPLPFLLFSSIFFPPLHKLLCSRSVINSIKIDLILKKIWRKWRQYQRNTCLQKDKPNDTWAYLYLQAHVWEREKEREGRERDR